MSESETVIIRKYGNRRLYRTDESRYVTLDELAQLVNDDVDFTVMDAKTGQELTSLVLAQVILDRERRQEAGAFPPGLLRHLIRMEDSRLAEFAQDHLPRLMSLYLESTDRARASLDSAVANGSGLAADPSVVQRLQGMRSQLDVILEALETQSAGNGA